MITRMNSDELVTSISLHTEDDRTCPQLMSQKFATSFLSQAAGKMGAAGSSETSEEDGTNTKPEEPTNCVGYLQDDSSNESADDPESNDNPCCGVGAQYFNLNQIKELVTFMAPTFTSPEVKDVMRAIIRDHFVYNTGVEIRSVHYNRGQVPTPQNGNHVCFAPRREVPIISTTIEILETLKLKPGHHFLHLGSGTGYINTLAGVLIGASGVNHGVEVNATMLEYAEERQKALRDHCDSLENFEYCEPNFLLGDCLKLDPTPHYYDRIFCSGMIPEGYETFLGGFLKRDGLLLFPQDNGHHVIVRRKGDGRIVREVIDAFMSLRVYPFVTDMGDDSGTTTKLPEQNFPSLQQLSRAAIRVHVRSVTTRLTAAKYRKRLFDNGVLASVFDLGDAKKTKTSADSVEDETNPSPKILEDILQGILALSNDQVEDKKELTYEMQVAKMLGVDEEENDDSIVIPQNIPAESSSESSSDEDDDTTIYSDGSDALIPPQHQFCLDCHIFKSRSVPKAVHSYLPNRSYPSDYFYGKINSLPLPHNLILYLKYKDNLIQ